MFTRPNVVGIIDSRRALKLSEALPAGSVDFLEWRADALGDGRIPSSSRVPWIATARHALEGGAGGLSTPARRALLLGCLDSASAIDIEERSLKGLADVAAGAREAGVSVIVSYHNFQRTPPAARLREIVARAADSGADVIKIAVKTESARDVGILLALMEKPPAPLALMGMGSLGMASRLLFAACGSALNYGWIDRPNVSGQWSAQELKALISKAAPRS